MISTIVGGVILLVLLILMLNFSAFKRLLGVGKAQAGKLARAAEALDRVAMYKEKIDEACDQLRSSKESLGRVKGLIAGLERKVEMGKVEIARLDKRIEVAIQENNDGKASGYIQQLQTAKKVLEENKEQLSDQEKNYQAFLKQVLAAQAKIKTAQREAEMLGAQLEISKVEAEIGDINQQFSKKADPLDEAARYKEEIQKEIDQNKARSKVALDVNSDIAEEEAEEEKIRSLETKAILEQYKKERAEKQIGSVSSNT